MLAGAVGMIFRQCDKLEKSIHACPSSECDGTINHSITINMDPKRKVCKRYVNGCCLDQSCGEIHCAVSALYYAENVANVSVDPIVKNQIWELVCESYTMNPKYYYRIVGCTNEILESIMCKGIRNVVAGYVGCPWYNNERDDFAELVTTRDKKLSTYMLLSGGNTFTAYCDLCVRYDPFNDAVRARYIASKKIGNEYLILTICNDCCNTDQLDIGLTDFRIFPIDKLRNGIDAGNYTLKLHENQDLEVFESNSGGQN